MRWIILTALLLLFFGCLDAENPFTEKNRFQPTNQVANDSIVDSFNRLTGLTPATASKASNQILNGKWNGDYADADQQPWDWSGSSTVYSRANATSQQGYENGKLPLDLGTSSAETNSSNAK